MTLKAVLFDLWGTLIVETRERGTPRSAWRTANVHRVLTTAGCACEPETVHEALQALSRTINGLHDQGKDPGARQRVDMFFELFNRPETSALDELVCLEVLGAIGGLEVEHAPGLAPGAIESLTAFRASGLRTGLISNAGVTTAPALRWLLDQYELSPLFDCLVFSDEVALAKPDPAIFREAFVTLGVRGEDCAFVGDSPLNDVAGSQALGMFAVQVGARTLEGVTPDAQIASLEELVEVLAIRGLLPDAAPTATTGA
jgi:HAD superfamily hydrolase (TIGR01509 family)